MCQYCVGVFIAQLYIGVFRQITYDTGQPRKAIKQRIIYIETYGGCFYITWRRFSLISFLLKFLNFVTVVFFVACQLIPIFILIDIPNRFASTYCNDEPINRDHLITDTFIPLTSPVS